MSVINTNIASLIAQRNLSGSQSTLAVSIARLSSGLRINSAKDDAAGLAIANRMDAQARGMNVAIRNANDGISLAQTAEGGLGKVTDMLQRMRELAVQSSNASNTSIDRDSLNNEFQQLSSEVSRTLGGTTFNGQAILGSAAGSLTFQIGADATAFDSLTVTTTNMSTASAITSVTTATTAVISGTTGGNAMSMIGAIDSALAVTVRRDAKPLRGNHQQPAGGVRKPERRAQSDHGCRLRRRNCRADSSPDPAAGRHSHAVSGQPDSATGPAVAQGLSLRVQGCDPQPDARQADRHPVYS
jgi:flagellin